MISTKNSYKYLKFIEYFLKIHSLNIGIALNNMNIVYILQMLSSNNQSHLREHTP